MKRWLLVFLVLGCDEQLPGDVMEVPVRDAALRRVVDAFRADAGTLEVDDRGVDAGSRDGAEQDASAPDGDGIWDGERPASAPDAAPPRADVEVIEVDAGVPPAIDCQRDDDCGAGEVCCTRVGLRESRCAPADSCTGGERDACLEDGQCEVRRPNWTVCCHDRGGRNYCAPGPETCQPVIPCEAPADCPNTEPCCAFHGFYEVRTCTSEFFATSPGDCR